MLRRGQFRRCGRAEPAPPRGAPRARRPCGESPEMTRKAIFSEGRTLCVRLAGPHECLGIPFSPDDEPRGRLAYRAHASVKRKPTLRACGARPSAGLVIRARMASRGKAGNNVGGGFLGGTRSPRPRGKAGTKPRHVTVTGSLARAWWQKNATFGLASCTPLRACGARPSTGGTIRDKMALRGKARDDAKSDFLGGARSPRPCGKAGRKPRHNMIIGGKRIPGGQMGTCSGEANSVIAGVRSPPLRRIGHPSSDGLAGKGPG